MPRPRFEKLPDEKRSKILNIASQEFTRAGFEGASYNRIISNAGLSKGAMYYYFDDKVDLYATVLGRALQVIETKIGRPNYEEGFWEGLNTFIANCFEFAADYPDICGLARGLRNLELSRNPPDIIQPLNERLSVIQKDILRKGQEMGAVRDDLPLEFLCDITASMFERVGCWLGSGAFSTPNADIPSPGECARLTVSLAKRLTEKTEA